MKKKVSEARKRENLAIALFVSATAIQISQGFRKRRVKSLDMATIYFQAAVTELSHGMNAEMPIVLAAWAKALGYINKSIRKKKPKEFASGGFVLNLPAGEPEFVIPPTKKPPSKS